VIPELTEQSPTVPVLKIQQPATPHSPAASSVTERLFNRSDDTYTETECGYKTYIKSFSILNVFIKSINGHSVL
jgi:hypothetical protein